jgi:hypothetical protein
VLAVLLLGECAVLTGARSFAAVAEYAHDAGRLVLAALGVGEVVRHESTLRRVLQKVDATALEAALRSWAMAQLDTQPTSTDTPRRERRRVLALDGKTLRGARIRRMLTVLSCRIWCRSSIRPAVSCSGRSRSRRRAARSPRSPRCSTPSTYARCWSPRTPCIPTEGTRTTYTCAAGYLMTIKANQPKLLARVRALPWAQIGVSSRERARGHGRVETRSISVVSLHPCPDLGGEVFPHAAQAIKLVRRRGRRRTRR